MAEFLDLTGLTYLVVKIKSFFATHTEDTDIHVTTDEKTYWNGKQDALTWDTIPTEKSVNPVTSQGIKSYVDSAVSGLYKYRGSVNPTYINSLDKPLNGDVYNISENGEIAIGEGGNKMYVKSGDNIAWVDDPITKTSYWDRMAAELDLSNFVEFDDIANSLTTGVVKSSDADGKVAVDDDGLMSVNGFSNKADKVKNSTKDNLASLDANGNIADSGKSKNDIHTHGNKDELDKIESGDKAKWDAMYTKPSTGIPKTDLATDVQTSLGLADSALQSHQDISGKEDSSNKVTSWSATTNNTNYPSEKLVKDSLDAKADDSGVVHKTANETINGDKTFNDSIYVGGNTTIKSGNSLHFKNSTTNYSTRINGNVPDDQTKNYVVTIPNKNGTIALTNEINKFPTAFAQLPSDWNHDFNNLVIDTDNEQESCWYYVGDMTDGLNTPNGDGKGTGYLEVRKCYKSLKQQIFYPKDLGSGESNRIIYYRCQNGTWGSWKKMTLGTTQISNSVTGRVYTNVTPAGKSGESYYLPYEYVDIASGSYRKMIGGSIKGYLTIRSKAGKNANIIANENATGETTATLPASNGTLALTTDIPDIRGKQDALPTTGTASSTYAINISGNAATANNADTANNAALSAFTVNTSGTGGGDLIVKGASGQLCLSSNKNGSDRGIWANAQGSGVDKWALKIDNDNNVTLNGNSATATKINTTSAIGSSTKGVYVSSDGTITACSYSVGKDVPSDANFNNTEYEEVTEADIKLIVDNLT